ncbi:beta-N-acetylhexosaminidase [Paenibacillus sp.]|uniref:beta-N-acetylhexosaminidase n=1 Tax=Paenibacillus sp. TaxID=58172 RepID=UPI002811DBB1|nr:beta-N-acetylhexosaminidase [Paenibacillus sp.]
MARIQRIHLNHAPADVVIAAKELLRDRPFEIADDGFPIQVEVAQGHLSVSCTEESGRIVYERKHQFFRMLGLFLEAFAGSSNFTITEESQFASMGIMFDFSRNAVFKVDSIQRMLRYMAWMGLDRMLLYLEDTYEIPERPYFGYMRGRYSFDELKACDDYADMLGIEIVPVIQTLGHVRQVLKWNEDPGIADNGDILLVGHPQTYELIRLMIQSVSAPLRSKRIHLGMDEAEYVGLGHYLKKHGYRNRFELMTEHLKAVIDIAASFNLEPMIWSDMYFKFASKNGGYYERDTVLPEEVLSVMPKDVDLVYWDYYHDDEEHYRSMLRKHRGLGSRSMFAGGLWTFAGLHFNYDKTYATSEAALSACKAEQVEEVFAAMWGDDGTETNYFAALPGMQLYAEHAYAGTVGERKLADRFKACTGASWQSFMDLSEIDIVSNVKRPNLIPATTSKILLWQDLLIGLFDGCVEGAETPLHYGRLLAKMEDSAVRYSEWRFLFETAAQLCHVLELKGELGFRIRQSYLRGDREQLAVIAGIVLPDLQQRVEALRVSHARQWFSTSKPFGWEVIDVRYGGLAARIRTAVSRLNDYVADTIDCIEELEAERLPFDPHAEGAFQFGCMNSYARILSASM